MPPETLQAAALTLRTGDAHSLDQLARQLTAAGYARSSLVEGVGQFSIRGGIPGCLRPHLRRAGPGRVLGRRAGHHGLFRPHDPAADREYRRGRAAASGRNGPAPPPPGRGWADSGPPKSAGKAAAAQDAPPGPHRHAGSRPGEAPGRACPFRQRTATSA